jgi:hypothetical protein
MLSPEQIEKWPGGPRLNHKGAQWPLDCRLGGTEGTGKGVSAGLAEARFAGADVAARARREAGAGRRHDGREPDQQNLSPLESGSAAGP